MPCGPRAGARGETAPKPNRKSTEIWEHRRQAGKLPWDPEPEEGAAPPQCRKHWDFPTQALPRPDLPDGDTHRHQQTGFCPPSRPLERRGGPLSGRTGCRARPRPEGAHLPLCSSREVTRRHFCMVCTRVYVCVRVPLRMSGREDSRASALWDPCFPGGGPAFGPLPPWCVL